MLSRVIAPTDREKVIEMGDISLSNRLDVLEPVTVREAVLVPSRGGGRSIGAVELDTKSGSELNIDPSDIAARIARLNGVQSSSGNGYSVLGADVSQNRTVVDGADFGGARVPRDAIQNAKLLTNTYDPSQGRFAGGEAVITTRRGSPIFEAVLRDQLVHPSLAWADKRFGEKTPINPAVSGYLSGPLFGKKLLVFVSGDFAAESVEKLSLLSVNRAPLSNWVCPVFS